MIYLILFILIPIIYFHYFYNKFPEYSSGNSLDDFKEFFGFNKITFDTLKKGATLAFFLIAISIIMSLIYQSYSGASTDSVSSYIEESYANMGIYFIVLIIVGSLIEEFFFRAFLIDRFGLWLATIAFALMHSAYGSWFEIIGALALGLVLGLYWKKDRDIYVLFIGHVVYNLFVIFIALA